ncbi:uncharacterized protein LOC131643032 [Vicia villosa]|uniref:uncharacterized protein LOC131643032 n=1 Tax=Vicia villosa TaxID=3911 RepID=UPI00273AC491|nr:uncharacterized protein LOC131643032 [Vicia villosa]
MILHQHDIFIWNCRGAASKEFYRVCKKYLDSFKPKMIVVVETRCDPTKLMNSFKKLGFDSFLSNCNQGYAGGICVAWLDVEIKITMEIIKFQFLHLKIQYVNGKEWYFTPIYASPNAANREMMWTDLKNISNSMSKPWLLAGDFNDTAFDHEKKGGRTISINRCKKFLNNFEDCGLMDLGAVGPKFTWKGPIYKGQRIYERLDRAFCNDLWRLEFTEGCAQVLMRIDFSDHHPLLIRTMGRNTKSSEPCFRFESAWTLHKEYQHMIQSNWQNDVHIISNLQNIRQGFKKWKFHTFQQILRQKSYIMKRLEGIQTTIQTSRTHKGIRRLEKHLQEKLRDILKEEELMWFQRSRAKWLVDGDRNTKYYHIKTVQRRRNKIVTVKDANGNWIEDDKQVQKLFLDHYKELFALKNTYQYWE